MGKEIKRKILPPEQLTGEAAILYEAVNSEPPLGCVLIATAFLEKSITAVVGKFLVNCQTAKGALSENGFLGEFSRCTDLAYCLGLISKGALENLKLIGKIRNIFAHSHRPLDFETKEVKEMCMKLTFPNVVQAVSIGPEKPTPLEIIGAAPRPRFTMVSVLLFQKLMSIADTVQQRQRSADSWVSPS
jgi:hypothetical protein